MADIITTGSTEKKPYAAGKVCAVPELLENILIRVGDPFQLFVLQRTNKTFKAVIADSKSIRQQMHLEPTEDRFSLRQFLLDSRFARAMHPFMPVLDNDQWRFNSTCRCFDDEEGPSGDQDNYHNCREGLTFNVDCAWTGNNSTCSAELLLVLEFAGRNGDTWRKIKIGDPREAYPTLIVLGCNMQNWACGGEEKWKKEYTLGDTLESARYLLRRHWGCFRMLRCAKEHKYM